MNLEKIVNWVAIVLVVTLGMVGLMLMNQTAESNKVTADIAKVQSESKSKVIKEVAHLSVEMENLQKDMDEILKALEDLKEKKK